MAQRKTLQVDPINKGTPVVNLMICNAKVGRSQDRPWGSWVRESSVFSMGSLEESPEFTYCIQPVL